MHIRRPHWRKMSWALILFTVLMLVWAIVGVSGSDSSNVSNCVQQGAGYLSQKACQDANDVGTGIGLAVLFVFWFVGFIVLSLIWFMTKPKEHTA